MDRLALVDTVVVDKTGTVTKGSFDFSGIHAHGVTEDDLLEYAAKSEYHSDHPISAAIKGRYGRVIDPEDIGESVNIAGKGIRAQVNGHTVHTGNARLMREIGIEPCGTHDGVTNVHVAIDSTYGGHISISDEPKDDSAEAIREMRELGVKDVIMLTGDNRTSASRVAEIVGITNVHSELLPEDKLDRLEEYLGLENRSGSLAYVGDGINDAPSIARADVGVAMGGIGSDSAVEAADVVIMNDSLRKLPEAIRISRRTRKIAYQNIVFSLGFKFAALGLATFGLAGMWFAIFADVGVAAIAIVNGTRVYGRFL
jgi:Cd2+/Zn2+-exporting ATPase